MYIESQDLNMQRLHLGVSVVIPTYNGKHLLQRFLPSILSATTHYSLKTEAPTEIIVVDDGSCDGTVDWLHEFYQDQVICVVQKKNQGFSPTCNLGFSIARHPIIWLLNNDVEVTTNSLLPLVEHFKSPEVFAVSSQAYRLDQNGNRTNELDGAGRIGELIRGYWKVYKSYDLLPIYNRTSHPPLYTIMASGGYMAIDNAKLKIMGGFEELLAPFYWEDVELCYRAWKRGWNVEHEPNSIVYHLSSATIPKVNKAKTIDIIATRNRMIMHWIHLHDRWFWITHLIMTALIIFADVITGRFIFYQAFVQLWTKRKEILARRNEEKRQAIRSDRNVLNIIKETIKRPGIVIFKNTQEYTDFWEKYRDTKIKKDNTTMDED